MSALKTQFDPPKGRGETKTPKRPRTDDRDLSDNQLYDLPEEELTRRGWTRNGRFLISPKEGTDDDEEPDEIQYTLSYVKNVEDSILQLEHSIKTVRHNNAEYKRILEQNLEQLVTTKRAIDLKIEELENTVITLIRALG